jgi:glycosyltransferase involved in cell wall biosynthesis
MKTKKTSLSIIVPVFNEDQIINIFFDRINKVLNEISNKYDSHILFVNNASTDNTYSCIREIQKLRKNVSLITLSKNFGYQCSMECGLDHTDNDLIAFIDVDCEDPPEMLIDFLNMYSKGYDIVYGERVDRHESEIIKSFRKIFYHLAKKFADEEIVLYMAEFSLFTNTVRSAILKNNNSFPFIRNSIARVGFNRIGIPYKRDKRVGGKTHYNFYRMVVFAISGILSSSTLPLRLPIYLFPLWLVMIIGLLFLYHTTSNFILLFVAVILVLSYFGLTLSFIAIYIARIYKNSLGHPNYIINPKYTHLNEL